MWDKDTLVFALAVLATVAALALAGTLDHGEELRHEEWLARQEATGAWVMR